MRLKIVSDGTTLGTHILAVDKDGNETRVDRVVAVNWHLDLAMPVASVDLRLDAPEVELVGECETLETQR